MSGSDPNVWSLYGNYVGDYDMTGIEGWIKSDNIPDKKCECGTHKVYGENCNTDFHSFWCPLYKETK